MVAHADDGLARLVLPALKAQRDFDLGRFRRVVYGVAQDVLDGAAEQLRHARRVARLARDDAHGAITAARLEVRIVRHLGEERAEVYPHVVQSAGARLDS